MVSVYVNRTVFSAITITRFTLDLKMRHYLVISFSLLKIRIRSYITRSLLELLHWQSDIQSFTFILTTTSVSPMYFLYGSSALRSILCICYFLTLATLLFASVTDSWVHFVLTYLHFRSSILSSVSLTDLSFNYNI